MTNKLPLPHNLMVFKDTVSPGHFTLISFNLQTMKIVKNVIIFRYQNCQVKYIYMINNIIYVIVYDNLYFT
jgi:hypothetical protein